MTLEEEMLQLKARNQFLETKNTELELMVSQLVQRVQSLEQQLKTNSRNSSKPPSSDSFNRPPKNRSLRQKSGKGTGGQPDQQGHQLALTDQPDHLVTYLSQHCQHCQTNLTLFVQTELQFKERRQVWDLLPLKVQVTEHQTLQGACPHCGKITAGTFPSEVVGRVQYGPGIKALALYLCYAQLLPFERSCEVLTELLGISLSQGCLA